MRMRKRQRASCGCSVKEVFKEDDTMVSLHQPMVSPRVQTHVHIPHTPSERSARLLAT